MIIRRFYTLLVEKSPTIINHVAEVDKMSKQKEQNQGAKLLGRAVFLQYSRPHVAFKMYVTISIVEALQHFRLKSLNINVESQ